MKIVLICEYPCLAREIIRELLLVVPELDRESFVVGWANKLYNLNTSFVFPRGQRYKTFPMVQEPVYRPVTFDGFYVDRAAMSPRRGISAEYPEPIIHTPDNAITNEDFLDAIRKSDTVYTALDAGPSGQHVCLRVIQALTGIEGNFSVKHIHLTDITSAGLRNSIIHAHDRIEADNAKLSFVRRYFDYNYLLNAYPIMGATFKKALIEYSSWPLSKHELQLLYFMRNSKALREHTIVELMRSWKCTGRYRIGHPDTFSGLGNASARSIIIDNLLNAELLQLSDGKMLMISDKGERLLQFMHPDCEDQDQVFRIYSWAQLPFDEAKAKIDRYIKTFFGKQKRFLSKCG